ncbi:YdcF family protein [Vibrio pectenicida]|uniref:YdcF family protein n=1 Tax=Vibrio pectenicida TaxID=62763 RepID=A0A427TXN0_9VIBR|nr:YdcF family protein [Vibrio pectenicida]RSD28915.1 YdcF family protein [Vibrio pectenicida]
MSFLALLLLLLFAVAAKAFKWKKTLYISLSIFFTLFTLIGTGVVPSYLLDNLQTQYQVKKEVPWSSNNAIVLLGAGTQLIQTDGSFEPTFFSYGRIHETATQYYSCVKQDSICKIIISGGDAQNNGVTEADIYQKELLRLNVPKQDIILEADSVNTWQNAQFTSVLLNQQQAETIVLVSSGLHMQRSQLYFKHFGIKTVPVRADYMDARISTMPLWYNFAVTDFALHEYAGILRYYVYNFMDWNATQEQPGDV